VNDDGALESFTAMLIALLLLLCLTFAAAFALITQYQRGRTAADLAALAAVGTADPCTVAEAVALRNGARLTACSPTENEVRITVTLPTGLHRLPIPHSLDVSARAGLPSPTVSP
jgi:secretion/DNA translocation related TadE-like protein